MTAANARTTVATEDALPSHPGEAQAGFRWWEPLLVAMCAALYLWLMQSRAPNGDGRVYIRIIESGSIVWNPNHLLMAPIGVLWYRLVQAVGLSWSIFTALQVLAGIAGTAAVAILYWAVPFASKRIRLLTVAAIFFSAEFMSMALAEEYFVVQMPLLAALFGLGVRVVCEDNAAREGRRLAAMGVLAALAAAISINNAVLAIALGPLMAFRKLTDQRTAFRRLLQLWGPGVLVGLPVLLLCYAVSDTTHGLISWLTSYQGDPTGGGTALYGIRWTPQGVLVGAARLVYGFVNCLVVLGQLGAAGKALLFRQPIEFQLEIASVVSTALLFVTIGGLTLGFCWWLIRVGYKRPLVRFGLGWMGAYLLFNFIFSDISDQFWFQILLPLWTLLAVFASDPTGTSDRSQSRWTGWSQRALATSALLLFVGTTLGVAAPRAFNDASAFTASFQSILRDGDLLITTGWDDMAWVVARDRGSVRRVLLMETAMQDYKDHRTFDALIADVEAQLHGGGRVLIARLYDKDQEGRPWEQLAKLGWPRARIQGLFGGYDTEVVGTVGGVVVRRLTLKEGSAKASVSPH